ncbi:MAG: hypothetical protein NKF70_12835 [Methanobacterium sp. ERen5]|nr:MAG: hypothetical protein NKF70_12835 [Methanobacterium sp. ERen5]
MILNQVLIICKSNFQEIITLNKLLKENLSLFILKNSSLSVSNESTLNVTQGDDAQVIAWINNDALSKIPVNNSPKANVTFTVFD